MMSNPTRPEIVLSPRQRQKEMILPHPQLNESKCLALGHADDYGESHSGFSQSLALVDGIERFCNGLGLGWRQKWPKGWKEEVLVDILSSQSVMMVWLPIQASEKLERVGFEIGDIASNPRC